MLSKEEHRFVDYWAANRIKRKNVFTQLSVGLPFAVILIIAIFGNYFSSWYKKADMIRNESVQSSGSSLIIVLLIAAILIIAFVVFFSARHRWDQQEQRYRELISKDSNRLH